MKHITGNTHKDERGSIRFVNQFDMSRVVRFYCVEPADINLIRAWQGHKKETKWFYAVKGSFEVRTVKVDNWESIPNNAKQVKTTLSDQNSEILEIPGGYLNGFRALEWGSVLLVYSDFGVEESKGDDIRLSVQALEWRG
jgi:dTDP-4-dehydrorhamnose 3,5-epimerase-like enzyme